MKNILLLLFIVGIGKISSQNNSIPIIKTCSNKENSLSCSYFTIHQIIIDELNNSSEDIVLKENINLVISSNLKFDKYGEIVIEYSLLHSDYPKLNFTLENILNKIPKIIPTEASKKFSRLIFKNTFYLFYDGKKFSTWNNPKPNESDYFIPGKVPVYKGCKSKWNNQKLKNCMSMMISNYIKSSFDARGVSKRSGILKGSTVKISVFFKVDKTGKVFNVGARSTSAFLEDEAIRIIRKLSKMEPGYLGHKPVIVPYSIPIVFELSY